MKEWKVGVVEYWNYKTWITVSNIPQLQPSNSSVLSILHSCNKTTRFNKKENDSKRNYDSCRCVFPWRAFT